MTFVRLAAAGALVYGVAIAGAAGSAGCGSRALRTGSAGGAMGGAGGSDASGGSDVSGAGGGSGAGGAGGAQTGGDGGSAPADAASGGGDGGGGGSGSGGGGDAATGDAGGSICATLNAAYQEALARARICSTASAQPPCSIPVPPGPSCPWTGCPTYVDDATELKEIAARWAAHCGSVCSNVVCGEPRKGVCVTTDGASTGTCRNAAATP